MVWDKEYFCVVSSLPLSEPKVIELMSHSGDSYTTTGFNETGIQPTPTNPLGNPTYPGYTASNGPNWIDYLTVKYNASTVLTYNLAYGGAIMNSKLVAPWKPEVSSIADQIQNQWFPTYAGKSSSTKWTPKDTLFAVFDGINDIGNSWWLADTATLNAKIFAIFQGLVDQLYYAGGRNFVFLNVPPVDRSPLALTNTPADQAREKADILAWNAALVTMARAIKVEKPDVNIFVVDSYKYFTEVLDKPQEYKQTALYRNTTSYCAEYQNGTPAVDTYVPACGIPVNRYFWLNSLHPTYPMHDVLAEQVSLLLKEGPNIC
ncbi:hypothetical protein VTL71DRAFT_11264 [Oculimacula yallundae]|uniref:Carbohydrate esterase family 16 protein n=1 Tax=Oculimacula yallundae TaxID=86028 RepID=A0ABR4CVG5_9HELO